jgi:hypothetical protein
MAVPTDGFVWNPKGWDGLGCIFSGGVVVCAAAPFRR